MSMEQTQKQTKEDIDGLCKTRPVRIGCRNWKVVAGGSSEMALGNCGVS